LNQKNSVLFTKRKKIEAYLRPLNNDFEVINVS
jgi:hypothetical protein